MSDTVLNDLTDLKNVSLSTPDAEKTESVVIVTDKPVREPIIDQYGRTYATGKRKNAIARVWIKPGTGAFKINGKELSEYFARPILQMMVKQPFGLVGRSDQYDVFCSLKGGGLSGQAGALRHGVSKALNDREPELRPILKAAGLLTRDPRVVERKKYGRRKARRSPQFSKR